MPHDTEMQTVPFVVFEGAVFDYERRLRRVKAAAAGLALLLAAAVAALGVALTHIPGTWRRSAPRSPQSAERLRTAVRRARSDDAGDHREIRQAAL